MTRPIYETEDDLKSESELAQLIGQRFNAQLVKLPIKYGVDFCVFRDKEVVAFIEAKCRSNEMNEYDSYMLSAHKLQSAAMLSYIHDKPAFLFVNWSDVCGYTNLRTCNKQLGFSGRKDRGDEQDMELVVYIPVDDFRVVK